MEPKFQCQYEFKTRNIGSGSYGEVSIVEKDGLKYAYKKIKKDKQLKKSYFYNPIELDIIFRLQSPYLVKGVDITVPKECSPEEVGLVSEFIDGNLGKDISNMSFTQRKRIMYDLAMGLKCMHDNDFLHLDIKLENVMYRKGIHPRGVLIDYGLSSYAHYGVEEGILTHQGRFTFEFNSPQAVPKKDETYFYNNKHDIWALGITFLEMIANGNFTYLTEDIFNNYHVNKESGNTIKSYRELSKYQTYYFSDNKIDSLFEDFVFKYGPQDIDNKELLKDLLKNMLRVNDKLRFDINQVINHPYFEKEKSRLSGECFVKKHKMVESLISKTINYKKGVKKIIQIANEKMGNRTCYILFMAIDIYMRFVEGFERYTQEGQDILSSVPDLEYICILIANKYFHWSEFNLDDYIREIENRIIQENLVYKVIQGRIRDDRYFKHCKNTDEIKFVFKYFFDSDMENLKHYLTYDGKSFMESHSIGTHEDNIFSLNIEDL